MNPSFRKKVFLDTNVFLDQLQKRSGMDAAEMILSLGRSRKIHICLSVLTAANAAYVMRKTDGKDKMIDTLKDWSRDFVILPNGWMSVDEAINSGNPDFEDALQISSATDEFCDAIVTRNKKDFEPYTDIPVFTPEEFLAKLSAPR